MCHMKPTSGLRKVQLYIFFKIKTKYHVVIYDVSILPQNETS